jgi:hypothetical protein
MKTIREPIIVEFLDFSGPYWEVLPIHRSPGTVFRLLQEALGVVQRDKGFRRYGLTAEITTKTIMLTFDCGEYAVAEQFATLIALSLGWRERDGVLVGISHGKAGQGEAGSL